MAVVEAGAVARSRRPAHGSARTAWPLAAGCLAVAAVVELGLRLAPEFDPFGWLIWGRQTTHLALFPAGAPSWKPLPWLITTPLSLAGAAAPSLWLIVACAGGLAGLICAYRLAARVAGPVAGIAAVLGIVLCREFVVLLVTGEIEPVTIALALGAAELHLSGRRRGATALLIAASLARPECAPLLALYGTWLFREDPGARLWLVTGAALLLALWFLPPYVSLGHGFGGSDPVFASTVASHDPVTVVKRAATIVIWPVAVGAALTVVVLVRAGGAGRRWALVLTVGAVAWVITTALMGAAGFPGIRRFMLPAAAVACVLAGAGAGLLWRSLRSLIERRRPRPVVIAVAVLAVVLAASGWYGGFRVRDAVSDVRAERSHAALVRSLRAAVRAAGGGAVLRACGAPAARFGFQSSIAWDLGVAVGAVGLHPARDIRRHARVVLFVSDRRLPLPADRKLLGRAGAWRIYGVRTACAPHPGRV